MKLGFLVTACFVRFFHSHKTTFYLLFDLLSVLLLVLDIRYDGKSLWISAIECFVKCLVVDLLQDRFESVKRLLKDLVPMGVCDLGNDRN